MTAHLANAILEVFKLPHAPQGLPAYQTAGSAGMDIRAALAIPLTLAPLQRAMIPTGLILHIPQGYEVQVRARSGLSIKHGITLINAIGTIDSDYRNEVMVGLVNLSDTAYTLEPNERMAQLVLAPVTQATVVEVFETGVLESRQGGFGSTGQM
ncbi:MAG: dUTP diphosphatase [Vampirovibrionales bacterium]